MPNQTPVSTGRSEAAMTLRRPAILKNQRNSRSARAALSVAMVSAALLVGATAAPAAAETESPRAPEADVIHVCGEESLNLVRDDGTRLEGVELARSVAAVRDYCAGIRDNSAGGGGDVVSPMGTAYGIYIRNSTQSKTETCPCGPSYRAWSIDVNANGVPYSGKLNNLNVIYRVGPSSGAWEPGPSVPITTYGTIPTVSGTMSTSQYITSIATLYKAGTTKIDQVQAVAP
jgi:hypothetical protein